MTITDDNNSEYPNEKLTLDDIRKKLVTNGINIRCYPIKPKLNSLNLNFCKIGIVTIDIQKLLDLWGIYYSALNQYAEDEKSYRQQQRIIADIYKVCHNMHNLDGYALEIICNFVESIPKHSILKHYIIYKYQGQLSNLDLINFCGYTKDKILMLHTYLLLAFKKFVTENYNLIIKYTRK